MERLNPASSLDQLSCQVLSEARPLSHSNQTNEPQPTSIYDTGIGLLTFDQLYLKTSRTVGYAMREVHGMTNPEDIDDCMQAGYFKIWQQLQKNPDIFADKPKRYIVQAIIFRSKVQRFSHQRYYHKIVYDADADKQRSVSILTTDQVDTWIDLERALGHVARQVEDTPAALLGLYCLITQATAQDVATTFGIGYSTLTAYKRQVKASLATVLEGYGPRLENSKPITVAAAATRPEPQIGLVTNRLFEAIHNPSQGVIYQYQATDLLTKQTRIPVSGHLKLAEQQESSEATYPTRWGGPMTLEQIINDPVVRRAAFAKARRLGLQDEDREDCVQQGFIRLWQKLRDDPNLLVDKGPLWAGIYVAYSGNAKQFHRHNMRESSFPNPVWDGQAADDYSPLGRSSGIRPMHAPWATEVDETIDVNRFMDAMMQHYSDHPRKLVALQAIMGAISSKEAARRLEIHEKNFAATVGQQVRQEVQALLPDILKDTQADAWEAKLARGEGVEHITAIAQEVMHDQRLLLALYVVTTSTSKKEVARTFGYGLTAFGKDIRIIKQMIAARYRTKQVSQDKRFPSVEFNSDIE